MLTAQEAMFWERLLSGKARWRQGLGKAWPGWRERPRRERKTAVHLLLSPAGDLLNSRDITLLQAVGEEYALDPEPVEEQLDLGDFFDELEAVRVELVQSLPRYRGKVNPSDVQT